MSSDESDYNALIVKNIDPIKLKVFLDGFDDYDKSIIKRIVSNTLYIKTDEMITYIIDGIKRFLSIHNKYNLYIPTSKLGSEHYIISKVFTYFNPIQIIYGEKDIVNNDYPIVLLDDAIYSSCNMCSHIDELKFNNKKNGKKINNKFYAIVAVLSTNDVQLTREFKAEIISKYTLDNLIVSKLFSDIYNSEFDKHLYSVFAVETSLVLSVFFEHKIANSFGSYQFYHKIIKNSVNRKMIDILKWEDIDEIINHC